MTDTLDLVCVGHVVREMIHFPDGVKGPFLGSPPAYTSVAASRQGASTGLVTKIGPDMPDELMAPIVQAGVDTHGVRPCERTTASELIYNSRGEKEIRYPAKAEPIRAEDVPETFRGCRMIYLCPMDNDVLPGDIADIAALGECAAVDLGGYGGVHMSKASRDAIPSLRDLACQVASHFHIVKASEEDVRSIFGTTDIDESARNLLDCGPPVVVTTLGAKGAVVHAFSRSVSVPPCTAHAVDTTGGGDTFMAGFLLEYLKTADPVRATWWGSATAAWVIERTGGVQVARMPTFSEVEQRVRQYA